MHARTHARTRRVCGCGVIQGEVDALAFIENFAIEEPVMALLLRLYEVRVRACVCVCVRACVRACMCACVFV